MGGGGDGVECPSARGRKLEGKLIIYVCLPLKDCELLRGRDHILYCVSVPDTQEMSAEMGDPKN